MKKRIVFLSAILFLAIFLPPIGVWAQSVNIAPMTWTPRSDWINVQTDKSISPHAVGNGVTDDTAAVQSASNLASQVGLTLNDPSTGSNSKKATVPLATTTHPL